MKYRALVVDDEAAFQMLVMYALNKQGFECDVAVDVNEAVERVSQVQYDVVVTDLPMSNKHGHALVTYLLALESRPVIVIHTGVIDPRLAKDLLARGVDGVVFKRGDLGILAAKVKALVERRLSRTHAEVAMANPVEDTPNTVPGSLSADLLDGGPVSLADLELKLQNVRTLLPISTSALHVHKMANDDKTQTRQLAAAVQRDAAFTAEVLRLANSILYNPSQQPIADLDRAIQRIGRKCIGKLALGMNALAALTTTLVPWMDVKLAWNRSLAAGLAVEMLFQQGGHRELENDLLLSSIMHPLGRVVLGTLYPQQYDQMVENHYRTGESLLQQERAMFPLSHTEVLSHLLDGWHIPKQVQCPLEKMLEDFSDLVHIPEPIRTKTELVKLAAFVGSMAVGRLESWDWVDVPQITMLKRLGITDLNRVIVQTKSDLKRLAAFHPHRPAPEKGSTASPLSRQLGCCNMSNLGFPFLEMLLPAMGVQPVQISADELDDAESTVLVNCIGTAPHRLATRTAGSSKLVIVTDAKRERSYKKYGKTIVLPCSYGQLRNVCREASQAIVPQRELVGTAFSQWA